MTWAKWPARFSSMMIGVQTNHAQDVPRLLEENDGVWRPVRGSEVVWMKKVRVEQNRAHRHPHRLTAQWLGKQAFRVSQTVFFSFCLCGFGSRLRTRDRLFWRWVCPGTQRTSRIHCGSVEELVNSPAWLTGSTRRSEKLVWIPEWFSPPCMWKNASYRFLSAACVWTGPRRKGAKLGWWLQTTGITLNHIVVQFPP